MEHRDRCSQNQLVQGSRYLERLLWNWTAKGFLLKHAIGSRDQWTITDIDRGGEFGVFGDISMVLDKNGNALLLSTEW